MADIINLRRARKAKVRAGQQAEAASNRVRFGRTKAERDKAATEAARDQARHDGQLREPAPGVSVPPVPRKE